MITIDPGKHPGWAYFPFNILNACGAGPLPSWVGTDVGPCLIERPTIYPRSPVPPNDIITLAIEAGRLSAPFRDVQWVLPRKWKGTAPKAVMHARIMNALTPEEHDVYRRCNDRGGSKDALDAIGLGLWKLGRL